MVNKDVVGACWGGVVAVTVSLHTLHEWNGWNNEPVGVVECTVNCQVCDSCNHVAVSPPY